ncbi:MAG: Head fiber protein, partial [Clostridiaceae bacterium]|nr:Head fiber protein [Clostridiaceae bacterium]
MSYNTKNYTEQGGEKTVIGGQLDIAEGGTFSFNGAEFSPDNLPKAAAYQDDSEASNTAELVEDFNRLLGKLKAAGLM